MYKRLGRFLLGAIGFFFIWSVPDYVQSQNSTQSERGHTISDSGSIENYVSISREKATEIATHKVHIPADFVKQNIKLQHGWGGTEKLWRISWVTQAPKLQTIEVGVNAIDGSIMEISIYLKPDKGEGSNGHDISLEEAVEIAEKYIELHYPAIEGMTLQRNHFMEADRFNIQFIQMVNGIPFPENEIRFQIGKNGEIEYHRFRIRNQIHFEPLTDLIPYSMVMQKISEEVELELSYIHQPPNNQYTPNDTFLAYLPKSKNKQYLRPLLLIDANSGEWIDCSRSTLPDDRFIETAVSTDPKPRQKPTNILTQGEAYQILKNLFPIPDNVVISHVDYKAPLWVFQIGYEEGPSKVWHAVVDTTSGEVIRFSKENPINEEVININLSKEEAIENTIEFVKRALPDKAAHLYPRIVKEHFYDGEIKAKAYDVHLIRKHDGIVVTNQGVDIKISAINGEIIEYNMIWRDIDFPPAIDVLSTTEAKDIYSKDLSIELMYMAPVPDHPIERKKLIGKVKEASLVYKVNKPEGKFLDARVGKWRDGKTGEIIHKSILDIEGHWAEQEIKNLVNNGLMEVEHNLFHPDATLTRVELIKLLLKVVKEGDGNNKLLSKILFHSEKEVSRESFAVMMVHALGYESFSKEGKMVPLNFLDKDKIIHKEHVGLVQKLGIMQGAYNNFRPKDRLTKAEAAVGLYRFLKIKTE
ncbi:YcdB/YcdC domain-containing protein [Pseudalkalibacillus salsuginis]|uniref:YcdB/YcdC domain-containing protein n=1 Tax=Pseudalkalibacillus salsuginis TaxID=2910972 RepID=UPI001F3F433B|nr:YcdB/YcdC domain-containing protein [Pseudalkalibacillus salsuginis]MCF6410102.1 DUF4901 domain-containing protein [Pseudalkalibacillus salsuginis]